MNIVMLTIIAYLLGAIPFGLFVAKAKGVDIRAHGSGNIGATNVFRVIGKGWGIFTLFLDILKGFVPAYVFQTSWGLEPAHGMLFGVAAIIGHTFPIYLKFKGGKGVATSAGVLLGIAPLAVGIALLSWILCMVITRYVSLSSIVASAVVAVAVWVQGDKGAVVNWVITANSLMVIWLHRANMQRLINGTENRFGKKR